MSELEDLLLYQIRALGLPEPVREYRAVAGRRWRWDFAWLDERLLVEVQGGVWIGGAHGRGTGIRRDYEKNNAAALLGFKVLQFGTNEVQDGTAVAMIAKALDKNVYGKVCEE